MKTKDNKGITLISLGLIILLLLIISSITIYTGINEIRNAEEKKEISELEMVSHAVFQRYTNYIKTNNNSFLIGQKLNNDEINQISSQLGVSLVLIPSSYSEEIKAYYRLNPEDLKQIGINDSQDTYIVNYLTGEAINETKKKTDTGKVLYTYSRAIFNNQDVTAF